MAYSLNTLGCQPTWRDHGGWTTIEFIVWYFLCKTMLILNSQLPVALFTVIYFQHNNNNNNKNMNMAHHIQ